MANIVTRDEYKTYAGVSGTAHDDQIDAALPWVDDVIRNYTDRDFATEVATETRTYRVKPKSRYVDIDDCTNITNVALGAHNLGANEYTPGPPAPSPVYYWIELYYRVGGVSPEMGFTYNLDRLYDLVVPQTTLAVTADYGWEVAPGDVKLAASEILKSVIGGEDSGGGEKQSEAIDSYSISWQPQSVNTDRVSALPRKAVDLLDQYRRINL